MPKNLAVRFEARPAFGLPLWAKSLEQKMAAFRELRISRVGRRARLLGTVEKVVAPSLPRPPAQLTTTPIDPRTMLHVANGVTAGVSFVALLGYLPTA